MANLSSIPLEIPEIIDFLKRAIRLKEVHQEVIHQRIVHRVAQERGLVITPTEIQRELERFFYEQRFAHPVDVADWLAEQLITRADLEARIYEKLLTDKLARDLFAHEIQEFFARNPDEFEQVLLYKITVPYESLAQEILYQILEEEISFYEAAHLYNINEVDRLYCGYEGKQLRRTLDPEIAELLFNASIGEVIGPLKSSTETYELFLVDDFFTSELTNEVYEGLLNQMLQEWLNQELNLYLATLNASNHSES